MGEAKSEASAVTLVAGEVLGDQTTTEAVKYLDLSPLFHNAAEQEFWVELQFSVTGYYLPVGSAEPETAPTITATSGLACMTRLPADTLKPFIIVRGAHFLAYSADAAIMRVARTSPPVDARG